MPALSTFFKYSLIVCFAAMIVAIGAREIHRTHEMRGRYSGIEGDKLIKKLHGQSSEQEIRSKLIESGERKKIEAKEQEFSSPDNDSDHQKSENQLDSLLQNVIP